MFVPGKLFKPSLILWVRPGAHPRVETVKGASLGYALASSAHIRLGWESLPGTNTLAYYEKL